MRKTVVATAVAAALGILGTTAGTADASTAPVLSGIGWKAESVNIGGTVYRIDALKPDTTYTITFTDASARTTLDPYALAAAHQLNALSSVAGAGIHFAVTTALKPLAEPAGATGPSVCPPLDTVSLRLQGTELGEGMSQTYPCVSNGQFTWGGDIWMDPEYWTVPNWFSTSASKNTWITENAVTHEIGHALGLDHPDTFTVPANRAVPVMHGSNGPGQVPTNGYQSLTNGGKFTTYDQVGIAAMVKNGQNAS